MLIARAGQRDTIWSPRCHRSSGSLNQSSTCIVNRIRRVLGCLEGQFHTNSKDDKGCGGSKCENSLDHTVNWEIHSQLLQSSPRNFAGFPTPPDPAFTIPG